MSEEDNHQAVNTPLKKIYKRWKHNYNEPVWTKTIFIFIIINLAIYTYLLAFYIFLYV